MFCAHTHTHTHVCFVNFCAHTPMSLCECFLHICSCLFIPSFEVHFNVVVNVCRVTVMKDKQTRQSKGVAFILYTAREDAQNAVQVMNGKILNKRVLKVSIAADNGRAREFIKRRVCSMHSSPLKFRVRKSGRLVKGRDYLSVSYLCTLTAQSFDSIVRKSCTLSTRTIVPTCRSPVSLTHFIFTYPKQDI
jgi:RNA recognition motif-containing protein